MCDRGIDTSAAAMRPTNGRFSQDSLHAQHGQDRDTPAHRPDSTAPTRALSAYPSFSSPQPQPNMLRRQPSTTARKEGHECLLLPVCWEPALSISTHPDPPEPAAQPCPATAPGHRDPALQEHKSPQTMQRGSQHSQGFASALSHQRCGQVAVSITVFMCWEWTSLHCLLPLH